MSDHDPRPDSPLDAVEALFARERAQLTDLPADDLHWQRIVASARGRGRSHRLR